MKKIKIKTPAKINLTLEILGKRKDGFHNIQSIMQTVSLYDILSFETVENKNLIIQLKGNSDEIPYNEKNLVYKVAEDILNKYNIKKGVTIKIFKRIPVGAGLAGGSTDCAATLKGMLVLFKINISKSDIYKICARYGADVSFCYNGGTVLATGIGNVLNKLPAHPYTNIILVEPNFSIQTKNLYEKIDQIDQNQDKNQIQTQKEKYKNNIRNMIRAIKYGDSRAIASNFYNYFEEIVTNAYPVIREIKYALIDAGALGASMTGTGSTMFGYFDSFSLAKKTTSTIRKKFPGFDVYLVKNLGQY